MKIIGLLIAALAAFHATASSTGVGRERTGDARRLPESQRAKTPGWKGILFTTVMTSAIRRCLSAGATRSRL